MRTLFGPCAAERHDDCAVMTADSAHGTEVCVCPCHTERAARGRHLSPEPSVLDSVPRQRQRERVLRGLQRVEPT